MFASIAACARGAFACAGSMQGEVINLADRALLLLVVLVWGRGAASVAKWRVRRVQGRGVCSCECAERAAVAIMMVTMLKKKSRETLFQCCRAAEGRVREVSRAGYRRSRLKASQRTETGVVGVAVVAVVAGVEAERVADIFLCYVTVGGFFFY